MLHVVTPDGPDCLVRTEDRWNELRLGRIWSDVPEATLPSLTSVKSVAILEPDVRVLYGLRDEQSERFFETGGCRPRKAAR